MTAEEKAEELYTFYDDLLALDLTLDANVTSNEITEFAKNCARKSVNEVLVFIDDNREYISDAGSNMAYWYEVRKRIEEIRD